MALDYEPVDSSMISHVGYDAERQQLGVRFKRGGTTHVFSDVPQDAYDNLMSADSVGKHFHANILPNYKWTAG
jgi:hypothetical protein